MCLKNSDNFGQRIIFWSISKGQFLTFWDNLDQRLILGLFGHFGTFFSPFCKFTFVEETSFFVNTLTIHLITKRYIK